MTKKIKYKQCVHPHFCYCWDSMFITPLMEEFESCTCECNIRSDWINVKFIGLEPFEAKLLEEWRTSKKC